MNIRSFTQKFISCASAAITCGFSAFRESINYYLLNEKKPHLKFWTLLCFAIYVLFVLILALPLLSLTEVFIVFSLLSLYTLILASIFGYLGFANAFVFYSLFIILVTLYWDKAHLFYAFTWEHEVYARQFSNELYVTVISFIFFILVGAFIISILSEKARKRSQQLEWLSTIDGLTEVYNHRFFHQRLEEEIARSNRDNFPIGLLMIDIDNFKLFNDRFGHRTGDHLLKRSAAFFKQMVRINDIVCRYGGDEYAIILPNITEYEGNTLANRLKKSFDCFDFNIKEKDSLNITISIGFSIYPEPSGTKEELILHADSALYKAKQMGRNQAQFYRTPFEDLAHNTDLNKGKLYISPEGDGDNV